MSPTRCAQGRFCLTTRSSFYDITPKSWKQFLRSRLALACFSALIGGCLCFFYEAIIFSFLDGFKEKFFNREVALKQQKSRFFDAPKSALASGIYPVPLHWIPFSEIYSLFSTNFSTGEEAPSLFIVDRNKSESFEHTPQLDRNGKNENLPFVQGLLYVTKDQLLETSGLYGASFLREIDISTGETLRVKHLPSDQFAEGITFLAVPLDSCGESFCKCESTRSFFEELSGIGNNSTGMTSSRCLGVSNSLRDESEYGCIHLFILLLTWNEGLLHVIEYKTFRRVATFLFGLTGWGITSSLSTKIVEEILFSASQYPITATEIQDSQRLWITTGGSQLVELDVQSMMKDLQNILKNGYHLSKHFDQDNWTVSDLSTLRSVQYSTLTIRCLGSNLVGVNELDYDECTNTLIGNIIGTLMIIQINPNSGSCVGIASLGGTVSALNDFDNMANVANGIAIPSHSACLENDIPNMIITGKRWRNMYFVKWKKLENISNRKLVIWSDIHEKIPFFSNTIS